MINTRTVLQSRRSAKPKVKQQEWPCRFPGCDMILYSKSSRFRHQNLHNNPANQYQCGQCQANFLVKLDLNDHERRAHTPRDSYVACGQCDRTFSTMSNLNAHKEIHVRTTTPEHVCNVCNGAYFHRSALKRHQRNDHGISKDSITHSRSASDDLTVYSNSPPEPSLTPQIAYVPEISCTYCSSTCKSEYEYLQHLGSEHFLSISKQCLINNCHEIINNKDVYQQHKSKHYC